MARFLKGNELNAELEKILSEAEAQIILVSPYIKLHARYSSVLKTKLERHDIEIILVFGKNEDDMSKSMQKEDFDFFKQFPNIEIRHEKRLHAKYYANENAAILTSMNLYNYSQDTNIEAGILTKSSSFLGSIANQLISEKGSLDQELYDYFELVIEQSTLLFKRTPQYESKILGFNGKYIESKIEVDLLSSYYENGLKSNFKNEINSLTLDHKVKNYSDEKFGYCIRSREKIPFNPKFPMSSKSFESWNKFKDVNYPEKYCHFSGEDSKGETTFSKPILKKNWKASLLK